MVSKRHLENALLMAIEDEFPTDIEDINKIEMQCIKKRFNQIFDRLESDNEDD